MNLDSLSIVCSQVDTLLKTLTKQTSKTTNQELNSLIDHHGTEVISYLLKVLFTETSNEVALDGSNINQVACEQPLTQLLASRIPGLLQRSDFETLLAQTYPEDKDNLPAGCNHLRKPIAHLDFLSKILQLSAFQKVLFGIAFSHHPLFQERAPTWVLQRLGEFVNHHKKNSSKKSANNGGVNSNSNTLNNKESKYLLTEVANSLQNMASDNFKGERDISPSNNVDFREPLKIKEGYGIDGSIIPSYHTIIDFLLSSKHDDELTLSKTDQCKEFIKLLKVTFPQNSCPVELIPMLYPSDPEYNCSQETLNKKPPVMHVFTSSLGGKKSKNEHKDSGCMPSKRIRSNSEISTSRSSSDLIPSVHEILSQNIDKIIFEYGYVFTSSASECESRLRELWLADGIEETLSSGLLSASQENLGGMENKSQMIMKPETVAKCMMMMGNTLEGCHKRSHAFEEDEMNSFNPKTWDVNCFLSVVFKYNKNLSCKSVCSHFDNSRFIAKSEKQFQFYDEAIGVMMNWATEHNKQEGMADEIKRDNYPLDFFFSKEWRNVENQVIFLESALDNTENKRDYFIFEALQSYNQVKISQNDDLKKLFSHCKKTVLARFWSCDLFIDCLIHLYDKRLSLTTEQRSVLYEIGKKSCEMIPGLMGYFLLESFYGKVNRIVHVRFLTYDNFSYVLYLFKMKNGDKTLERSMIFRNYIKLDNKKYVSLT